MSIESIPHRLRMHARTRPDEPAYYVREETGWAPTSWHDYADRVERAARAMIHLGIEPEDAPAIIGFNAPSWSTALMAGVMLGGKPTGVYTTNSAPELAYIVGHAESTLMFVENKAQWEKLLQVRDQLPLLKHVVLFEGHPPIPNTDVMTWDEFMALGDTSYQDELLSRLKNIREEDAATLIYTSGTTGPPKAVILTHGNLMAAARVVEQIASLGFKDRVLSYLPLSHVAEQLVSIHGPAYIGNEVYYATSLEELGENLGEVQPTVFFGVPRVWEKVYDGIQAQLQNATGVKKALAGWAFSVGERGIPYRLKDQYPTGFLGFQYRLADKLVFSKIRDKIGLGDNQLAISGAAPIVPEVLTFFAGINIVIQEVYGQSEGTALTSFNLRDEIKADTVGRAVPTVEVKIAEDGEILSRGRTISPGYYKDEAATKETFTEDGWLRTGDLGEFDEEGYLKITGRKKEIIITAGGKNIAPNNMERALKRHPLINEAVLIGDEQRYLTALLTLEPEGLGEWAEKHGAELVTAHEHPKLRAEIQAHLDAVNPEFARVEQVQKFTLLPENFTVEAGQLTPSLKIKRRIIVEQFDEEIRSMYA